jgi:putative transposase
MTGPNPTTDRGNKIGTKRHVLRDQYGVPLSVVITSANTHDMKALKDTLDSMVVKDLHISRICVCLDKGYEFSEIEREPIKRRHITHIPHMGEEEQIKNIRHITIKRWVVERTNS